MEDVYHLNDTCFEKLKRLFSAGGITWNEWADLKARVVRGEPHVIKNILTYPI
jgi:hypothetical protein